MNPSARVPPNESKCTCFLWKQIHYFIVTMIYNFTIRLDGEDRVEKDEKIKYYFFSLEKDA